MGDNMKYVAVRVSFLLVVVVLWASLTTAAVQSVVDDGGASRESTPCQTNDDCAGYVCSPLGMCLGNVPTDATVDAGLAVSRGGDGSNGVGNVHGALVGMFLSLCTLALTYL